MGIVNFKHITQAVVKLIEENLSGYIVSRNEMRPTEPQIMCEVDKGWIGVYRGGATYDPRVVMAGRSGRWKTSLDIVLILQVASMETTQAAEDKLQDAEYELITLISNNPTLSGTVGTCLGYDIKYEYDQNEMTYMQAAVITIKAEVVG